MKLVIATEQGKVCAHFGHCEGFTFYDVEDGAVKYKSYEDSPGHQPGVLPAFLKKAGAEVVVAGGMGERAQMLFEQQGIQVIVGVCDSCDKAAQGFAAGTLKSTGQVCDSHSHE